MPTEHPRALLALLLAFASPSRAQVDPTRPSTTYRGSWEMYYLPAATERRWLASNASLDHTCEGLQAAEHVDGMRRSLEAARAYWERPWEGIRAVADPESPMSQLVFCPRGSGLAARGGGPGCRVEPIEPLTPTGRHPFARIGCPGKKQDFINIFNISNLVLRTACDDRARGPRPFSGASAGVRPASAQSINPGRALFFDAGCSVWDDRRPPRVPPAQGEGLPYNALMGSATGSSLQLFSWLYAGRCSPFDDRYGWEAMQHKPGHWWRTVPPEEAARLHFFNVPVSTGEGMANPLRVLRGAAREADFVAFKLDIDTPPLEREIVEELLWNRMGTGAGALVDEFFFEYHFPTPREPGLHRYWGRKRGGSLADAMHVMYTLRRNGIRAHFWI